VGNSGLIAQASRAFGAQCVVLSMDVLRVGASPGIASGYEIVTHGGRTRTGLDAVEWAVKGQRLGAGELVVNSIDADGTKEGYEINLTRLIADAVSIPVIASGGGGKPEHLAQVLTEGRADAALVASMLHYGEYTVRSIKEYLHGRGIPMRLTP
jgi:cyclase